MNQDTWERLKNLALFKVWMTDRQLKKFWPVAATIALIIVSIVAFRYFVSS
jgi:hypothetical protein